MCGMLHKFTLIFNFQTHTLHNSARIVKIYEGILLLVENQGVQFVIAAFLKNRCYEIESGGIFEVIK